MFFNFPMNSSEFKNFISVESYDEKLLKMIKISRPYLIYFPGIKPSKSVTVRLGRIEPGHAGLSF